MNLPEKRPAQVENADRLADTIIERVGKTVVLALPLGLGKANHVANALFARAAADRSIRLRIFTGLTLGKPRPSSELERRFLLQDDGVAEGAQQREESWTGTLGR